MLESRFWIIGHKEDFDYIIIGKNTGPYSEFPKRFSLFQIRGDFYYIKNFISQINDKKRVVFCRPAFSKCFYLDELNKNVKEPDKAFDSFKKVIDYIKESAYYFIKKEFIKKNSKKILENFLTQDIVAH